MARWSPALVILLLSATACRAAEPLPASYCVAVSAMEPDAEALNGVMDAFATAHAMTIDISPTTHNYENETRTTSIGVDRMGDLGAVISSFRSPGADGALERALEQHVETAVAGRWTVRRCQDVKGFKGPWRYEGAEKAADDTAKDAEKH